MHAESRKDRSHERIHKDESQERAQHGSDKRDRKKRKRELKLQLTGSKADGFFDAELLLFFDEESL